MHIVDWLKGRLADPATLLLVLDPAIRTTVMPQQVQLFTSIAALCLQADPDLRCACCWRMFCILPHVPHEGYAFTAHCHNTQPSTAGR